MTHSTKSSSYILMVIIVLSIPLVLSCCGRSLEERARGEAGDKKIEALLPKLKQGMSVEDANALGLTTFCVRVKLGICEDAFPANSTSYTLIVQNGRLQSLTYGRSNVNLLPK